MYIPLATLELRKDIFAIIHLCINSLPPWMLPFTKRSLSIPLQLLPPVLPWPPHAYSFWFISTLPSKRFATPIVHTRKPTQPHLPLESPASNNRFADPPVAYT